MLHVAVLQIIQKKFAHFVRNAHDQSRVEAKISWKTVTLPKHEGGLRIKDLRQWNQEQILKHLIDVISPRSTSLRAEWVCKLLLSILFGQ